MSFRHKKVASIKTKNLKISIRNENLGPRKRMGRKKRKKEGIQRFFVAEDLIIEYYTATKLYRGFSGGWGRRNLQQNR